jgi:hypothetical protein
MWCRADLELLSRMNHIKTVMWLKWASALSWDSQNFRLHEYLMSTFYKLDMAGETR